MATESAYRRSRKHVLDWLQEDKDEFLASLNGSIELTGARVTADDLWMPGGYSQPREARLDDLDDRWLPPDVRDAIAEWWLVHQERANTPNWDLLATCSFSDRRGLVLVEAKAHRNELKTAGKALKSKPSDKSKENNTQIGAAIREACDGVNVQWPGFSISRDSHYQLSNRMAFGWKLASLGVPTVLLYLGFIGDTGIPEAEGPFMSTNDWDNAMCEYAKGILPEDFVTLGIRDQGNVEVNGTPFAFLIRSRPILSPTVYPQSGRDADNMSLPVRKKSLHGILKRRSHQENRSIGETLADNILLAIASFADSQSWPANQNQAVDLGTLVRGQLSGDSTLFEVASYVLFRIDLWHFKNANADLRAKMGDLLLDHFSVIFQEALPSLNISALFGQRVEEYTALIRDDDATSLVPHYFKELVLLSAGNTVPVVRTYEECTESVIIHDDFLDIAALTATTTFEQAIVPRVFECLELFYEMVEAHSGRED